MLLTPQVLSPIAGYIARCKNELCLDTDLWGLVERDKMSTFDEQSCWWCDYSLENTVTYNNLKIANKPIVILDIVDANNFVFGGSSAQDFLVKISVIFNDLNMAILTRDYLVLALEWGLKNGDIAFSGCGYIGGYTLVSRSKPSEMKSNGLLLSNTLVKLKMRKADAIM